MERCEDCGCRVINGRCVNCDEETFIVQQYIDQEMDLPSEDTEFMKKFREQESKKLK